MRIAMWSGPRNISTAMMRSFGNRPDTFVCDEPLYAHYLKVTGIRHPGADEVIAHHETDWRTVVRWLTGPHPSGATVFYQKHMAHHLLPEIDRAWLGELTNCFLIRDPRAMVLSLTKKYEQATLAQTGLPQQVEIFEMVSREQAVAPAVIDARDVLEDPRRILGGLCDHLGIAFTDRMLHWPAGPRKTDGIWARHWYDAVEQSTGFKPYKPKDEPVPEALEPLCEACMPYYEKLHAERIV
jgi:hypothetical protein